MIQDFVKEMTLIILGVLFIPFWLLHSFITDVSDALTPKPQIQVGDCVKISGKYTTVSANKRYNGYKRSIYATLEEAQFYTNGEGKEPLGKNHSEDYFKKERNNILEQYGLLEGDVVKVIKIYESENEDYQDIYEVKLLKPSEGEKYETYEKDSDGIIHVIEKRKPYVDRKIQRAYGFMQEQDLSGENIISSEKRYDFLNISNSYKNP